MSTSQCLYKTRKKTAIYNHFIPNTSKANDGVLISCTVNEDAASLNFRNADLAYWRPKWCLLHISIATA